MAKGLTRPGMPRIHGTRRPAPSKRCVKLMDGEATSFLLSQGLLSAMQDKRDRQMEEAEDGKNITVSIGSLVSYGGHPYVAHIFHVGGYGESDGWVVHLWPRAAVFPPCPVYSSYMLQMSQKININLWDEGV